MIPSDKPLAQQLMDSERRARLKRQESQDFIKDALVIATLCFLFGFIVGH